MLPDQENYQFPQALPLEPAMNFPIAPFTKQHNNSKQPVLLHSNFSNPIENSSSIIPQPQQGFSFLQMLEEEDDEMLMMAATQYEKNITEVTGIETMITTSTTVMKKSSSKLPIETTFVGCRIGSIGTVNIHIHNH